MYGAAENHRLTWRDKAYLEAMLDEAERGGVSSWPDPKDFELDILTDYSSCRLLDIPQDFAWGVATAAF